MHGSSWRHPPNSVALCVSGRRRRHHHLREGKEMKEKIYG